MTPKPSAAPLAVYTAVDAAFFALVAVLIYLDVPIGFVVFASACMGAFGFLAAAELVLVYIPAYRKYRRVQ